MAVPEQTPYKEYTANGVTKIFPLEFDVLEQDHLIVLVNDLEPTVGSWSLDAVNATVVFALPPANGANIKIRRDTPLERTTDFESYNNSFRPKPVNNDFDRIWWKLQEIWVQIVLLWASLNSKISALWLALSKETQDRIKGDLDIRAWVQILLNNIVDNGLVSAIAVTTVESVADLHYLVKWDGRTVYVKGYYRPKNFAIAQPYKGGGTRIYNASRRYDNDGFLCINGWVLQEALPTPYHAGAIADGLNDDTSAIQKCVNAFSYIDMRNSHKWIIKQTITIPSNRVVDLSGSDLHAEVEGAPIFKFETAGEGLTITHGGGVITGVADSFLYCEGTTFTPTSVNHSARQIRLDGIHVVGTGIKWFCDWQKAVRQVFMTKIQTYTSSGFNVNGKCVEIEGYGCIFYGATDDLNSRGFKLRAPGGGRWYSEGFHFTDCTIDNYGITFDITDIYAMSITGGFVGSLMDESPLTNASRVAVFGRPTSTTCRDIKFTAVNIYGSIEFRPEGTGGYDYQAKFTGCTSTGSKTPFIHIKNNASNIDISNHKFHSAENGIAIVCDNNNYSININGISCDPSFVSCVQIKGVSGANCSVRNVSYAGSGDPVYTERPVLLSGIQATTTVSRYMQKFNTSDLNGSRIVGEVIASVTDSFAKGEAGEIVCEISYSGADVANQRFDITVPSGMVVPSGTGWNSRLIFTKAASGRLSVRIPYYTTEDISNESIVLTNSVGSTVLISYHGIFGFKRNF